MDRTLTAMGKILWLKTSCTQLGSETQVPHENADQDGKRISGQASAKLFDSLFSCAGELQSCAFSWCAIRIESSGRENLCLVPLNTVCPERLWANGCSSLLNARHSMLCQRMCQRSAKSFSSRHAEGRAHLQKSHGHPRLDIEAARCK